LDSFFTCSSKSADKFARVLSPRRKRRTEETAPNIIICIDTHMDSHCVFHPWQNVLYMYTLECKTKKKHLKTKYECRQEQRAEVHFRKNHPFEKKGCFFLTRFNKNKLAPSFDNVNFPRTKKVQKNAYEYI